MLVSIVLALLPSVFGAACIATPGGVCNQVNHYQNCIANDTLIEVMEGGMLAAALVKPGDKIRGVKGAKMEPAWCTVIANTDHGYGRVVGEFTPGHMVAREPKDPKQNVTIVPYEVSSTALGRMAGLRNIATECELTVTASGKLFTPFSEQFCAKELSWSDYRELMSSVLTLTKDVSFVWDVHNWLDNTSHPLFPALNKLCADIIDCTKSSVDSTACAQFETTIDTLVNSNLEPDKKATFHASWPNATAMNQAMHIKRVESAVISLGILSGIALIGCIVLVALVAYLFFQVRRLRNQVKDTAKEIESTNAAVKAVAAGERTSQTV